MKMVQQVITLDLLDVWANRHTCMRFIMYISTLFRTNLSVLIALLRKESNITHKLSTEKDGSRKRK